MELKQIHEVFEHLVSSTESLSGVRWIEGVAACLGESLGAELVMVASCQGGEVGESDLTVVWQSKTRQEIRGEQIDQLRRTVGEATRRFSTTNGACQSDESVDVGRLHGFESYVEPICDDDGLRIGFLLCLFSPAELYGSEWRLRSYLAGLIAQFVAFDVQRLTKLPHRAIEHGGSPVISLDEAQEAPQVNEGGWVDELTGLGNTRYLKRRCRELCQEGLSSDTCYGVIQVDVDFFKTMNTMFDRATTDHVVLAVADALVSACSKAPAQLFRTGPDSFVAIVQGARDLEDVAAQAESIRAAIEGIRVFCRDGLMWVSACLGVAIGSAIELWQGEVLEAANTSLDHARRSGFNCVVVAPGKGPAECAGNPALGREA